MDAVAQMVYPALCHQFFNDAAGVGGNLGLETAGFAAFLSLFFLGGIGVTGNTCMPSVWRERVLPTVSLGIGDICFPSYLFEI